MTTQQEIDSSVAGGSVLREAAGVSDVSVPAQRIVKTPSTTDNAATRIERFRCCDVEVAALDLSEAVDAIKVRAQTRVGGAVHLCNTFTLTLARESKAFCEMLNADPLSLADGTPLTWVARMQGHGNVLRPTRGAALMSAVIRDGLTWGAKHYFYGSSPEVIDRLRKGLPNEYAGIEIVGSESPPFRPLGDEEKGEVRRRFADSGAHYVWVGLGTPKQDWFVHEFAPDTTAVFVAVGAAFDFAAGTLKEAPVALHGSGLEWVFRLISEPRRLGRRYAQCSTLIPRLVWSAFGARRRTETSSPTEHAVDGSSRRVLS